MTLSSSSSSSTTIEFTQSNRGASSPEIQQTPSSASASSLLEKSDLLEKGKKFVSEISQLVCGLEQSLVVSVFLFLALSFALVH